MVYLGVQNKIYQSHGCLNNMILLELNIYNRIAISFNILTSDLRNEVCHMRLKELKFE